MRGTMADLVAKVRLMIGDTDNKFDDDDIERVLDRYCIIDYAELLPHISLDVNGEEQYLQFSALYGNWEADALFYCGGEYLTPALGDWVGGWWKFSEAIVPPIYIQGKRYDVYASAAELLEMWAAQEKLSFDFSSDGQSFSRSQKVRAMLDLAQVYRDKSFPSIADLSRSDAD